MRSNTAIFWDMGGVILTNGWDRESRQKAVEKFHLDWGDLEDRHELLLHGFETGRVSLEEYLARTVFYRPRPFTKDEFRNFMFQQSQPMAESLAFLGVLASGGNYFLAAINNESLELNEYRIAQFGLRGYFEAFFSSCYLGVRKPDREIYQLVLRITQRDPAQCIFVDDRGLNLECARELGMRTIQFQSAAQVREELERFGVRASGK